MHSDDAQSHDEEDERDDDPIWGDWGRSEFNNGKGIAIKLTYFPLDQSTGRKRKNAKPISSNKKLAMHEDFDLDSFLVTLTRAVQRLDLLQYSHLYHADDPSGCNAPPGQNSLQLRYSIHGTSDKDIDLDSVDAFKDMVMDVRERSKPQLNVDMHELKVDKPDEDGGDAEGGADGIEDDQDVVEEDINGSGSRPSKRQKTSSTAESAAVVAAERDRNEKASTLMEKYKCNDKKCKNQYCFPYGPNFSHGAMVPLHFREWSAAWADSEPGVDVECPPSTALFDFAKGRHAFIDDDITDIELLANRRLRTATTTSTTATPTPPPASHVNVSFQGLADVLRATRDRERSPPVRTAQPMGVVSNTLDNPRHSHVIPPHLSLDVFCAEYELLHNTSLRLKDMDLAGPHILRLLENKDLQHGGLSVAQVAEVRDAEQRWLRDVEKEVM